MTDTTTRFRRAMARYFDQPLTPEIAAAIEREAFEEPDRAINPLRFAPLQCGSLSFQMERLATIVDEIDALTAVHWNETEAHRHGIPMRMDYPVMLAEERRGTLVQFTARCEGRLVGNFRLYLRHSRHTGTPFAIEDTLFLLPEARRGRNAKRLLFYVRDCLLELGVREFRASTKHTRPAAARLLEHCGFKAVATEYVLIEEEPDHVQ